LGGISCRNKGKKGLYMFRKIIFSAALAALLLAGCNWTSHNFKIQFNDIQGLKKNVEKKFETISAKLEV
jgi:hypothetical protein